LTGANGKAYLYSGNEASSISATVVGGKTGIDANIINSSIDVNVSNTVPVSGSFATESTLETAVNKLDLIFDEQEAQTGLLQDIKNNTVSIEGKIDTTNTKLDTVNTSIGTGNTSLNSINGKVPSGLSVSNSRLLSNSQVSAYNINLASVQNLTCVIPNGTEGVQALHTYSYGAGYYDVDGTNVPFNMSLVSGKYCLNVYDVPKEEKQYMFGGTDFNGGAAYRLIGGLATSSGLPIDLFNYGLANPRVYYASLSGGAPNNNLFIDYIDAINGDLVESALAFPVVNTSNNTNWTLLPSMIGPPIKIRTSASVGSTTNTGHTLYISPDTNTNRGICCINISNYGIGVFTIPNGYIGYISSVNAGFNADSNLILVKWDVNGVRQVVYKFSLTTSTSSPSFNLSISSGYEGSLGGIFTAGESVAFTNNIVVSNKTVQAVMTLRKI